MFRTWGRHLVLSLTAVAVLFPVLWAFVTSWKSPKDLYGIVPTGLTLDNYRVVFTDFPLPRLLLNTMVTATVVTVVQLVIGVLASYALVRFRVRWSPVITALLVGALVIPAQSLIIPQFFLVSRLGWLNSYPGLIAPQVASCALAVLLLRQHVRAIPPSLISAAQLDGATAWETLRYVVVPALRPALGAVAILVFLGSWNEYLWPLLAAPSPEWATVEIGLQMFMTEQGSEYGPLLAAATLSTLPVVVVYLFASRRITDAFLQSGIR